MGKSSKSRGKNIAKQERAMHLENVEDWKKTMSTIDNKFCTSLEGLFTNGKKRERVGFLQEQIQLTLNVEESFAFINRYKFYKTELSGVCSLLLFEQCLSAKYIQASNSYNEMMNYSLTEDFRFRMKPFSDLFLLWTGSGNVDKKEAIAKIIKNAFEVIHTHEAKYLSWLVFLEKTLVVLIRQPISKQHFEKVELLSLTMLRNVCKGEFKKVWMKLAQTFLVFSYIDKFRFYFSGDHEQVKIQAILKDLGKMRSSFHQLPFDAEHLVNSLLEYYELIYEKEEHSSKSALEFQFTNKSIESLKEYIALRSIAAKNICYTCKDDDTPDHEGLVCQGCRVVSYCCKYHQRLNYLHHEETGTRGLGHKHLCPVFKAYRRKRENTDTSKDGHFDRKFQRACKRALRGTLENNLQLKRQDCED